MEAAHLHSARQHAAASPPMASISVRGVAALAASLASAAIAAVALCHTRRQRRGTQPAKNKKTDSAHAAIATFHKHMQEREYTPLIPKSELSRIRKLYKRVHDARGFRCHFSELEAAWERAMQAASTPENGGWARTFKPADMNKDHLTRLCMLIDELFLGGLIAAAPKPNLPPPAAGQAARRPTVAGTPSAKPTPDPASQAAAPIVQPSPLRLVLVSQPDDDWFSCVDDTGAVFVNQPRWAHQITSYNPMRFEGALCSCNLEALLHCLAHELAHLLIFLYLPDIDRCSIAYLPEERHGPIFMLLNKKLFGHTSHDSRLLFKPANDIP